MIGSLRGRVLDRTEQEVLVEVGGVGYRVLVSPSTAVALGGVGDEALVHIHHHVREDAQTLYGFASAGERRCFEALLGAHGVGPALALAILSVHSPESLQRTLADDDIAALCLVPGVGKKTAARLLVELKSRFSAADIDLARVAVGGNGGTGNGSDSAHASAPSLRADVRDALAALGYGPDEIREALVDVPDEGDVALLLKQALQRLAFVR
jgi:Holliday junction DNA helicase RuvA